MVLADAGIPVFFIQWVFMLFVLIPVIVVEALLVRRWIPLSYGKAFLGTSIGNLASTIVGVPIAWLAVLIASSGVATGSSGGQLPISQMAEFMLHIAWIPPNDFNEFWIIPLAITVVLVPCFIASVLIEGFICLLVWRRVAPAMVLRGVYRSNLASYGMLFVLGYCWTLIDMYMTPWTLHSWG